MIVSFEGTTEGLASHRNIHLEQRKQRQVSNTGSLQKCYNLLIDITVQATSVYLN